MARPCSAKNPAEADPATAGVATATRARLRSQRREPTQRRAALPRTPTHWTSSWGRSQGGRMSTMAEGPRHQRGLRSALGTGASPRAVAVVTARRKCSGNYRLPPSGSALTLEVFAAPLCSAWCCAKGYSRRRYASRCSVKSWAPVTNSARGGISLWSSRPPASSPRSAAISAIATSGRS
jgi:hypothetical protein